jgi:hypothetical protein
MCPVIVLVHVDKATHRVQKGVGLRYASTGYHEGKQDIHAKGKRETRHKNTKGMDACIICSISNSSWSLLNYIILDNQ